MSLSKRIKRLERVSLPTDGVGLLLIDDYGEVEIRDCHQTETTEEYKAYLTSIGVDFLYLPLRNKVK
jgi:hypothetical protein